MRFEVKGSERLDVLYLKTVADLQYFPKFYRQRIP